MDLILRRLWIFLSQYCVESCKFVNLCVWLCRTKRIHIRFRKELKLCIFKIETWSELLKMCELHSRKFILSNDSFLSVLMWYVQMFFVSNITPRNFKDFLFWITIFSIFRVKFTGILFFFVNNMYWDFSAENMNPVF
jgi:hypothetical protein